jgi:small ligand-binding sensory domain FIST
VIATAGQGAAEALAVSKGQPLAALAFNCAGRRSKLKRMEDELSAIQKSLGKDLPLFGCYCAGEIGPVDTTEEKKPGVLSGGSGWHLMFTIIAR